MKGGRKRSDRQDEIRVRDDGKKVYLGSERVSGTSRVF